MNSLKTNNKNRGNSLLEITRYVLLVFLLFTHLGFKVSGDIRNYMDLKLMETISHISVDAFAMITGMFVYKSDSQMKKNISRVLFIIATYSFVAFPLIATSGESVTSNIGNCIFGGQNSWYLYAVLIIYFVGPKMYRWLETKVISFIIIIALGMLSLFWFAKYVEPLGGLVGYGAGPFMFVLLFPLSLLGYAIKRLIQTKEAMKYYGLLFFVGLSGKVFAALFAYPADIGGDYMIYMGHISPLTIMMSFGLIGLVSQVKWYSAKVNAFVANMYFIYEYHWAFYIFFHHKFAGYFAQDAHLWGYLTILITLGSLTVLSFILTQVQRKWWIPFSYKKIDKFMAWIKVKYYKQPSA